MGCSHSKVDNVVIEPITAPTSECGKPSDLAFTELIVEQDDSRSSVPAQVEEAVKEEPAELAAANEEEPVDPAAAVEESSAVEVVDVEEEPIVGEEAPVEKEETSLEPEAEAEEEVEVHQEKSAVVEKSAVTEKSAAVHSPVLTFTADKVAFSVGVAFFNIVGSTGEEDAELIHVAKRYSEFKVLHHEMAKLMTKEELPRMPGTSFLQGRNDRALLQEREVAFVTMLNAIAQHPEASQSAPFVAFLA